MSAKWPVHAEDEIEAVARVLRSGRTNYWTGEEGVEFEREWAAYTGARFAMTVSSGTTALEVALSAMASEAESTEIIVPARTFVATASACVTAGFSPVLADIDAKTLNVTVETLEARLTPNICGVIVVHYAGHPADMPAIMEWATSKGVWVIEDAAHAHGSRIGQQHVGTFGDIGCFSMCVGKTMSTGGEGGAIITDNIALYRRMQARRDHGRYQMVGSRAEQDIANFKYTVERWGTNARMTEMQSAIARLQLQKLDGWVARRREIAARYDAELGQHVLVDGMSPYMYLMRVPAWKRDAMLKKLHRVGARWGGCANIGHEPVFGNMAMPCPVADAVSVVSLPIYPTLSDNDVSDIIIAVRGD